MPSRHLHHESARALRLSTCEYAFVRDTSSSGKLSGHPQRHRTKDLGSRQRAAPTAGPFFRPVTPRAPPRRNKAIHQK